MGQCFREPLGLRAPGVATVGALGGIVALDLMVKTELLMDVGNDLQLLGRIKGALTPAQRTAANDALDKVLEAGAFLTYEKRILSHRTFGTPDLESERGNCVVELDDLLKKATLLGKQLSSIVLGDSTATVEILDLE